jgi:hypothetical protein
MGRASDADAPIAGILGRVTELPRYIGRHASADDAVPPPGDSASADGGYQTDESTTPEPRDEGSDPDAGADPSSMPPLWRASQGPPSRPSRPWPGPSVGQAPPFPPRSDPASADPFSADSERTEPLLGDSDSAESGPTDQLAGADPDEPKRTDPSSGDEDPVDSHSADSDQAPAPPAAVRPEPVPEPDTEPASNLSSPAAESAANPVTRFAPEPAPEPAPLPGPEPEPEPEPDEALETAPRVHLSMAPRPRSEQPSDEPPGFDPESEPEPPERTAVPYSQALPETEAEPQVYSLPEHSYPDEPPRSEGRFPERAADESVVDTHGLARLALMDAVNAVWPGGTPDLTTWLAENLDLLEDPLGFALSPNHQIAWMPTRSAVRGLGGDIAPLDIPGNLVTSDTSGAAVMVRAQVDPADTDGLGALLSAAAVAQAQTAVWICPHIDEDLRQTLRWIGGDPSANVRLYGLEMYLVRIGGSATAPLFDAVVSPGGGS